MIGTGERVRVPWVVGTVVQTRPFVAVEPPSLETRCERKRVQITGMVAWLEGRASRYPAGSRARQTLQAALELQRRRLEWLRDAQAATPQALAARRRAVEEELGADGLSYLENGLPEERIGDQRFEFGLCELALIRFVQGG